MNSEATVSSSMIVNQEGTAQQPQQPALPASQAQESVAAITPSDSEHTYKQPTVDHESNASLKDKRESLESKEQGLSESERQGDESTNSAGDAKNDSSTLSTAFTISFEDDAPVNSKKQFGIRDSIRKFAPPKPHTIEKPRPSKSDPSNQDNSYMSIESAPGGCQSSRQTFRRDAKNSSCRSSGRKSDSSRHSNISESAAFLIDKMLDNCKQGGETLSSMCDLNSSSLSERQRPTSKEGGVAGGAKTSAGKKLAHSSDDILDDEIDFCEERSDNGTYIVGADPESDAARRKIDELFGVVKAAEASLMKEASSRSGRPLAGVSRPSRLPDKKVASPMTRERQDHIERLATTAGRHSSRSSSSSRQELASSSHHHRQRSATRQSRNSSCDRASKLPSSRHRRATSQSSRQSSNHDHSEVDTRSSRSSLQNEVELVGQQAANNPSMKFNRAFALRRARLGLGEPSSAHPLPRMASNATFSASTPNGQVEVESSNLSPRRTLAQRYANQQTSSGGQQQNLSRTDGGRFSLRMRNNPVPGGRLMGGALLHDQPMNRTSQQAPPIDSYLSKVQSSSSRVSRFSRSSYAAPSSSIASQHNSNHSNSVHSTSAIIPPAAYQSSDELELLSPSGYRSLTAKSLGARRENLSELEADVDYASDKFNYSLGGLDYSQTGSVRACNSSGRRGSASQLGALDCLVISAISSLSVKIRGSVCDLMVEHAKRLPSDNETRLIVEEIVPQLTANSSRPKSPTSIEEIDQSLYFDLAQALKNLKKVEQMVDVMKQISGQLPDSPSSTGSSLHTGTTKSPTHSHHHHHHHHHHKQAASAVAAGGSESNPNSESTSLSPA